ncbi:MAG: flavodoxin family protein [Deltaproteobacteria bacterium]|nr:flavodoxin family protein [Deltaproteobacteria bacterium]
MDVVGIYFSPRAGGNSDLLMDEFLKGALSVGAGIKAIYARDLDISGCLECGGCDKTGECVIDDDMSDVYPLLIETKRVAVASPVFFYGPPAQGKALIDRCQALWSRTRLDKNLKRPDGYGFLLGVGATKGQNLFEVINLCAKYFLEAIGLPLKLDSLTYRKIEGQGAIKDHPTALSEAFEAGKLFAGSGS